MVHVIVLDLGGVLMAHDPEAKRYFRSHRTPVIERMEKQLSVGAISAEDFLRETGYTLERWNNLHAGISAETMQWLAEMSRRYPLYLLSNNDTMRWAHVLELYPDFTCFFRACVLSQQVGVAKPDERIYRIMEERIADDLGELPAIRFVDDSEENRLAAERLGWETYSDIESLSVSFR